MRAFFAAVLTFQTALSVNGQTADLAFVNAKVRTLDAGRPVAAALAVSGGRIIAVGSNNEVRAHIGPRTEVIDAGGRALIPGFNDAHVHLTGIGNQFSHLDLNGLSTRERILERIRHFSRFLPKGRWMLGRGWSIDRPKELPTLADLDTASPQNPVLLYSTDNSAILVNSIALRLSGQTSEDGILTGTKLQAVRLRIPPDHARNWAEIAEAASLLAASLGVTSVQDVHSDDLVSTLADLEARGRLKTRVYECIGLDHYARARKWTSPGGLVRSGCVKGMAEGINDEEAALRESIMRADSAGLQVMIHAIGPRANENAIAAFEDVIRRNGRRDRRFRVEHAHRMQSGHPQRLASAGVIASMQPALFFDPTFRTSDDHAALIRSGVRLAFGSDASMIDLDPLLSIHAAVNSGDRSITVEEALRAYTIGSAYAEFQENEKGTLSVGKLADLVLLSDDVLAVEKSRINAVYVLLTVVNGKVVYRSDRVTLN